MTQPSAPPAPLKKSLRSRALQSSFWIAGGSFVSLAIRLGSTLVLTRLLAPEAFGLLAIAGVVQMALALLSDVGIRAAVVQNRDGDKQLFLDTAWVLQIGRGFIICIGCVLVAAALYGSASMGLFSAGSVYASPELPLVLAATSLGAVILGFESSKAMAAERAVNMSVIVRTEVISQAVTVGVGVLGAWLTGSFWAIVWAGLVGALTTVALSHLWMPGERGSLRFDKQYAKEIFLFGRWILASSSLHILSSSGDRLLLSLWAGTGKLGLYSIAHSLATVLRNLTDRLATSVGTAALSETARSNPEEFRRTYYKLRLRFDAILLAGSGFGFATGQLIIDALYDPRYAEAGWMLQALFLMLIFSRYAIGTNAYVALGLTNFLFRISLIKAVAIYVGMPLAYLGFGLQGAILAFALHELTIVPYVLAKNREVGLSNWRFELGVLPIWFIAYGLGYGVSALLSPFVV